MAAAMSELSRAALDYTLAVRGSEGELLTRALLQARKLSFVEVNRTDDDESALTALLQKLYPQKFKALGSAVPEFLSLVRGRARTLELGDQTCIYTAMTFLLGWRFEDNPMFPWANRVFSTSDPARPSRRRSAHHGGRLASGVAISAPLCWLWVSGPSTL